MIYVISLWNGILSYSNRIQVIKCDLNEIKMFHSTTDARCFSWRIFSEIAFDFFLKKIQINRFDIVWHWQFDSVRLIAVITSSVYIVSDDKSLVSLLSKLNSTFVHSLSCQGKCSRWEILVLCAQSFGRVGFFLSFVGVLDRQPLSECMFRFNARWWSKS